MSEKAQKRDMRGCPKGAGTVEAQPNPKAGPDAAPGRIGNPPHEVTDEMLDKVRLLAKVCDSYEAVAVTLRSEGVQISAATIQRHYHAEYMEGRRTAINGLRSKLMTAAMGGSVNAIWKALCLLGEVKRQPIEVTGPGGGPVQTVDLTRLSDKQLEEYGRLAAIAEGIDPDSIFIENIEPDPSA